MKITLITVCYNSEATIKETFESVLNQKYDNYEYIVVDGLSKDKTLKIIKEYEKKFKGKMRYLSEKDKGLYDAMNKGIRMAKGDIIGILNSDDILANDKVFKLISKEFNLEKYDAIYGDLLFLDEKTMTKPLRKINGGNYSKKLAWRPPHPTLYVKKEVYDEIGDFDLKYRISSDMDFMLRMIRKDYKFKYIKKVLVHMRSGGVSTQGLKGYYKSFKESYGVLKDNNYKFPFLLNVYKTFLIIIETICAKFQK